MKKILIMGARSFTGKSMIEAFTGKYEIKGITREDFDFQDSKSMSAFFRKNHFDVIINCSAQNIQRKIANEFIKNNILENNLKIFFNIENFLGSETKLINFGSGAQYNKNRDLIKIEEDEIGKVLPDDQYGYSKYIVSRFIKYTNKNIVSPILFGLYGQNEDYTFKFISNAIVKNLLKLPIIINQNVVFDYLYIDDFLRITEYLIENDVPYSEFNMTPCESIDLLSIANIINDISDFSSEIVILNDGLNYQYTGCNTRLMSIFNNQFAFTSYKDGIRQLYLYYKNNLNKIDFDIIQTDAALWQCHTRGEL